MCGSSSWHESDDRKENARERIINEDCDNRKYSKEIIENILNKNTSLEEKLEYIDLLLHDEHCSSTHIKKSTKKQFEVMDQMIQETIEKLTDDLETLESLYKCFSCYK